MSSCRNWLSYFARAPLSVAVRHVFAAVVATLCGSLEVTAGQPPADENPLSVFRAAIRRDLTSDLAAIRPPALSAAEVQRVEAFLPRQGELEPTRQEMQKISEVRTILRFHNRDVIVVKVIDVPQAVVGLHARAVLLLSRPALKLLNASELRAVAAHEIGHDFFWDEYLELRAYPNPRRRRALELRCDGVAVVTLAALNAPLRPLETALRKLVMFNGRLGELRDVNHYPTLGERSRFISELRRHIEQMRAGGLRARATARDAPGTR